jgi:hypothetical protein
MADVEIRGKISVDTGNTQKSVNEMIESIKTTKKAINDAKVGSVEYGKAQADLKKQTQELDAAVSKNGGSFGKLKDTLGQALPGFKGASEGASGLGKQLWLLVANPIVLILTAIIGALALLYKAFASTNDGADKIEQVMAGLGATIEVLRDRVLKVAEAIGKFFAGDFKGALETGKAAVKGIGQEIADEFAAAADATKTLQDLEDAMRGLSVGRAELNRDLARAKEIMSDADAGFETRRKALNEVRTKESEQNRKELEHAKAEYDAIVKQNRLSKNVSDENLDSEAAAKVKMIDLQTSSATQIRSLNRMERMLARDEQQKADEAQKARDERIKKDRERKDKEFQDSLKKSSAAIKAARDEEAGIIAAGLDLDKKAANEKQKLADEASKRGAWEAELRKFNYEAEQRMSNEALALKKAQYAETGQMIANAIDVLGKQTIAGKALAVAQALMNTYSGATDALRAKSTLPSPFDVAAKVINVGLVLATGFKAVKAITAVQVPGGGGSMPSIPSATGAGSPLSPTQSSTSLNAGSIQGIGNAATGGVNRTFVLESDIKNNRERVEQINRAARLG